MAKGQMKGNKEPKKPKAIRRKSGGSATSYRRARLAARPPTRSRRKSNRLRPTVGGSNLILGLDDCLAQAGSLPSVPTMMRQSPPGSLPLRAEVTASDGYAPYQ